MFNCWKQVIKEESSKEYYKKLTSLILEDAKSHKIYPPSNQIFNLFNYCDIENIKVVIVGMDPYHGPNQAHGLAFSVDKNCKIPPSLKNIFKEINIEYKKDHVFKHGNLEEWAKQGVFLINSSLTVREGQPNSHSKYGWHIFTDRIISLINERNNPIVYMLWGNNAKEKQALVNNPNHLLLTSAHPSPLSAYNGFFGNNHFISANSFLQQHNVKPIDWFYQGE